MGIDMIHTGGEEFKQAMIEYGLDQYSDVGYMMILLRITNGGSRPFELDEDSAEDIRESFHEYTNEEFVEVFGNVDESEFPGARDQLGLALRNAERQATEVCQTALGETYMVIY